MTTACLDRPTGVRRPAPSTLRKLATEVAIITVVFVLYNVIRIVAAQDVSGAFTTATHVWELERAINLPSEQALQALILDWPTVVHAANIYYIAMHFPVILGTLFWLFFRRPSGYSWCRNALIASGLVSLFLYWLVPVAPPRLMPNLGFIDTGVVYGLSAYPAEQDSALANQFAAMPSLHVGWAVIAAVVLIKTSSTRWRYLWIAHPILTMLVVVITANHYWLDGFIGAALVLLALYLTRHTARFRALKPKEEPRYIVLPDAEGVVVTKRTSQSARAEADRDLRETGGS